MAATTSYESMFRNLKAPRNLIGNDENGVPKYRLMRGVSDYGNLAQWNMYETGYAFLKIVKMPKVLSELAGKNDDYKNLLETFKKIVEFEFKQINGLPNIDSDKLEITNNISTISLIGKTTMESNITFSLPYYERSGAPLTKLMELWMRCIKDPKTTYKHYMGLISDGTIKEPGFEHETATFLVGFTDNTGLNLERSYLILGVQPNSAPLGELHDYTKGTIENKELSLEFSGFAVTGREIDRRAKVVLDDLNNPKSNNYIIKDETQFVYTGTNEIDREL